MLPSRTSLVYGSLPTPTLSLQGPAGSMHQNPLSPCPRPIS